MMLRNSKRISIPCRNSKRMGFWSIFLFRKRIQTVRQLDKSRTHFSGGKTSEVSLPPLIAIRRLRRASNLIGGKTSLAFHRTRASIRTPHPTLPPPTPGRKLESATIRNYRFFNRPAPCRYPQLIRYALPANPSSFRGSKTIIKAIMSILKRGLANILQKNASDVVFVSALRTPVTRAKKGGFKDAYPEELLAHVCPAYLAPPHLLTSLRSSAPLSTRPKSTPPKSTT